MHLDDRLDTPLYQQLFDQLRHRIEEGGQPEGSRLPPIRSMAADLGCARNTVENAYALLAQEGYVKSRPGSGYIVQNVAFVQADADRGALLAEPLIGAKASRARYDFTYGDLEPGTFPAMTWRAITDDILLSVESAGCDAYNDPFGEESLRAAIAWRLSTQRGIDCTPAQIVIQGGAPRRACRTCSHSSTPSATQWPWRTPATTACARSSSDRASRWLHAGWDSAPPPFWTTWRPRARASPTSRLPASSPPAASCPLTPARRC